MTRTFLLTTSLALALALNTIATAATITSPSQLTPGYTTIDFEGLPSPSSYPGAANLVIGDATFVSESGAGLAIVSISIFGIPFPGADPAGNVLNPSATDFISDKSIRINFATPVSEILLTWIDPNFSGNRIDAYDSNDTLLETAFVPTTGGATSTFAGIARSGFDISYIRTVAAPGGDIYLIDNVRYNAAPAMPEGPEIPEPASVVLMGLSMLGVGGLAWRRRRRRQA